MRTHKRKLALLALVVAGLVAGTVVALPRAGYYIYYYNAQGDEIGGRERTCWGSWYTWGTTSNIYEQGYYECP